MINPLFYLVKNTYLITSRKAIIGIIEFLDRFFLKRKALKQKTVASLIKLYKKRKTMRISRGLQVRALIEEDAG